MKKNVNIVATSDYDDVVSAVTRYAEGLREGDSEGVSRAFHADAIMYGFAGGSLLGGPIKNLYDFVDQNGSAPEIRTRIDVLAITPTTAVVRVELENDAMGGNYTDFHTLMKQDGSWRILAKVFHAYDA